MRFLASLKNSFSLYKIFKIKKRHVFTRRNTLRMRYMAGGAAAVCVFTFMMANFSVSAVLPFSSASNNIQIADAGVHSSGHYDVTERSPNTQAIAMASIEPAVGAGRTSDDADNEFRQNAVSNGIRKASFALKKPLEPSFEEVSIGTGETLAGILQEAGLNGADAYYAVKALSEHHDPRSIKAGQNVRINFEFDEEGDRTFESLALSADPIKTIHVYKRGEEQFETDIKEKKLVQRSYARKAKIETSLYGSAARADIPSQIVAELIRIYSWNVDFQRDVRRGDKVEVLYEAMETEGGDFARYGDVLFAKLNVGGREVPIYRYEMKDGRVDYFDKNGTSAKKILMKTPVDGARISSTFGMRRHPVLGYNKMHKGMDFAASTGTPIYAAGDGTIDYLGRRGGYGNYIRIRHNGTLKTAYAHMHNYARGMKKGKRVKQGEVIGYVGTTGRSTGPHLHYEVLVDNKQVNPSSVNLPTGEQLAGAELSRFKALAKAMDQQYMAQTEGLAVAKQNSGQDERSKIR